MSAGQALPELASVPWRARTDARWLRRWERIWQAWTLLYTVPFAAAAAGMLWLDPVTAPVALVAAAHAWIIPAPAATNGTVYSSVQACQSRSKRRSQRASVRERQGTAASSGSAWPALIRRRSGAA